MWHIVFYVPILFVSYRTYIINALVHTASEKVHIFAGLSLLISHKRLPLHIFRYRNAREAQHGWRQIDKTHKPVGSLARFTWGQMRIFFRETPDHWHMGTTFIYKSLASRDHATMITVISHNCIVRQSSFFELLQYLRNQPVEILNFIIILRPIVAHFRSIRVIRRQLHFCRIMSQAVVGDAFMDGTFMTYREVENGKEGLAFSPVFVMCLVGGFVPNSFWFGHVVIFL